MPENSSPQHVVARIQPPLGLEEDTLEHAIDVLASTFQDDPFMRYFQLDEAAQPPASKLSYSYLKPAMKDIVTSFIEDEQATLITVPGKDVTSAWFVQRPIQSITNHIMLTLLFQVHTNSTDSGASF